MNLLRCALIVCLVATPAFAQNDTAGNDAQPDGAPLIAWHFDGAPEAGVPKGASTTDAGPRAPVYPSFKATNNAWAFTGGKSILTVREKDVPGVNLRFNQGDSITLEAWLKVAELKTGQYAYLVGKGRNRRDGFPEQNQNYALRLLGDNSGAKISFLFASAPSKNKAADWHRWSSSKTFALNGWHHVAIAYTFGNPKSIRGYIDGEVVAGAWDMGGATTRPPVSDGDDLTLGTGNGGGAGNTFRGWLDDVQIWRAALPEATLMARYQYVPPPPAIDRARLTKGSVLVELCEEGMPTRNAWPDSPLRPAEHYNEDCFGFFEVPQRYIDTGVRDDRPNPFLFRAAARVTLPAGKHRLLLRSRGASRLYIDDKLLMTTPWPQSDGSGHGSIRTPDSYLNLGPTFRFAPPGNREGWMPFTSPGGEHVVVMEAIVGGFFGKSRRRPELGETVVAWSREGNDAWHLLAPGKRVVPYTDAGWDEYQRERAAHYERVNATARQAARDKHADYWQVRQKAAKDWLVATPDEKVPPLPNGYIRHNAIDHFVAAKLAAVAAQTAQAKKGRIDYFTQVQPLLEARCYDCHAGTKVKGNLRLDDRAAAFKSAIVPGQPEKSELLARIRSHDATEFMPPKGERLTKEQVRLLETWISDGAHWPDARSARTPTPLTDDLTFLRRVTLDTVGVVPSPDEIDAYLKLPQSERRTKAIDRLLADERWADHWVGYWQDVLAENPNILNPTLNNTGPFRWWLLESLRDNKPMDLFVTELLRMKGSVRYGGPAGFGIASQNDAPMATKGMIVASAFLGVEMKCARCHDAPAHASTQKDLFHLAALLGTKSLSVPASSSVPLDRIHTGGRKPLINVTLKPGTTLEPRWPFADFVREDVGKKLAQHPDDARDRLAALITAPQNERFAQVIANRVWRRLMGRGLVEPVDDWERSKPTHPELLRWLGREFVRGGYDVKHLARLILNSRAYQRATDRTLKEPDPLYAAPAPRRLDAEQIVDGLFAATGKPFRVEEVSLDIDGLRDQQNSISLGRPRRAWMLTSTSNERDRPSLALPRIQAVTDVLHAFGWRGARQEPTSYREQSPNVLQPAILSNGTMGGWLTRLSDDHAVTHLALKEQSLETFLDALFLRLLTRSPSEEERKTYLAYIKDGYATRLRPAPKVAATKRQPEPYVSWSNHLDPEATLVRQRQEEAARQGDPPTGRLEQSWRARLEDVLWALVNSSEFVFRP